MSTVVEFNNATLADAIKRANIVAPTKGRELDMFKGFVIDLIPGEDYVILRTTNGELFYAEFLYPEIEDLEHPTTWRVPSGSCHGIVSNLKTKGTVKFKDEGGKLRITSGRMRASLPLIRSDDYPELTQFLYEQENMLTVQGFGSRLDQVGWATADDNLPPGCAVVMTDTYLAATNRAVLARVPNKFEFNDGREKVVIPYRSVAPLLRTMEEVQLGVQGGHMVVSPTEDIFIKFSMFEDKFPPVEKAMDRAQEEVLSFSREEVADVLTRVTRIGTTDRQVALEIWIGGQTMTLSIKDRDSAEEIDESVQLLQGGDHELVRFMFSVENFSETINKFPGKTLTMEYSPSKPTSTVKMFNDAGYEVVLMPRAETVKSRGEDK